MTSCQFGCWKRLFTATGNVYFVKKAIFKRKYQGKRMYQEKNNVQGKGSFLLHSFVYY